MGTTFGLGRRYNQPVHIALIAAAVLGWLGFGVASWQLLTARAQLKIARDQLKLDVQRATPHIGSNCEMRPYHPDGRPDIKRYAIDTTLYNDGDVVARRVEGQWQCDSSHGIGHVDKPIRLDSLSSAWPWEWRQELGGNTNWIDSHRATVTVRLSITYLGLDDKSETYTAEYEYDHDRRGMVRISSVGPVPKKDA